MANSSWVKSDVTSDDPIWQKKDPQHTLRYPPLRFLTRHSPGSSDTSQTRTSRPPSALSWSVSDDGSDLSFSSTDTIIDVTSRAEKLGGTRDSYRNGANTDHGGGREGVENESNTDNNNISLDYTATAHNSGRLVSDNDALSRRQSWKCHRQNAATDESHALTTERVDGSANDSGLSSTESLPYTNSTDHQGNTSYFTIEYATDECDSSGIFHPPTNGNTGVDIQNGGVVELSARQVPLRRVVLTNNTESNENLSNVKYEHSDSYDQCTFTPSEHSPEYVSATEEDRLCHKYTNHVNSEPSHAHTAHNQFNSTARVDKDVNDSAQRLRDLEQALPIDYTRHDDKGDSILLSDKYTGIQPSVYGDTQRIGIDQGIPGIERVHTTRTSPIDRPIIHPHGDNARYSQKDVNSYNSEDRVNGDMPTALITDKEVTHRRLCSGDNRSTDTRTESQNSWTNESVRHGTALEESISGLSLSHNAGNTPADGINDVALPVRAQGHMHIGGSVPEATVNNQSSMQGMYYAGRRDVGLSNHHNNMPLESQTPMEQETHVYTGDAEPDEGLGEDEGSPYLNGSVVHPSITALQNDNSDNSSVDSEGLPCRKKSALKIRSANWDETKRTGRKVRFAEPLVMHETVPLALSARERLGLNKDSVFTLSNGLIMRPRIAYMKREDENQDDVSSQDSISDNGRDYGSDAKPTQVKTTQKHVRFITREHQGESLSEVNQPHAQKPNEYIENGYNNLDRSHGPSVTGYSSQSGIITRDLSPNSGAEQFKSRTLSGNGKSPTMDASNQKTAHHHTVHGTSDLLNHEDHVLQDRFARAGHSDTQWDTISGLIGENRNNEQLTPGHVTGRREITPTEELVDEANNSGRKTSIAISRSLPIPKSRPKSAAVGLRRGAPVSRIQNTDISENEESAPRRPVIMRHTPLAKQISKLGQDPDIRHGMYMRNSDSSPKEFASDERISADVPMHIKVGQKVLPEVDLNSVRLSNSHERHMQNDQTLQPQNVTEHSRISAHLGYGPNSAYLRNGLSPNPASRMQSPPSMSQDLAVDPSLTEGPSVPSPVSGDSGISSTSSLTDLNRDIYPTSTDNLGENYNTLNYIKGNKTKNTLNQVNDMRNSRTSPVTISPQVRRPVERVMRETPPSSYVDRRDTPPSNNVVRRSSSRNPERRRVRSDMEGGGKGDLSQWARVIDNRPNDDMRVGYGPMTDHQDPYDAHNYPQPQSADQSAAPRQQLDRRHRTLPNGQHRPPDQNLALPHDGHHGGSHYKHNVSPSVREVSDHAEPESPYGFFLRSATNRQSTTKLVPIPLDILNPAPSTPDSTGYSNRHNTRVDNPASYSNNSRYSAQETSHDHSMLSSPYSPAGQFTPAGQHSPGGYREQYHPGIPRYNHGMPNGHDYSQNGSVSEEPQYSSTADIYKLLRAKTRNPFVKSNDFT